MQYLKSICEKMRCSVNAAAPAVQLIASADLIHHAMKVYRSGEIDEHLPARPAIEDWVRLYRGGPDLLRGLTDGDSSLLGMDGKGSVETLKTLGQLSWMARNKSEDLRVIFQEMFEQQETIRELARGIRLSPRAFSIFLAGVARELREREAAGSLTEDDGFISSPEMLFYVRVQLPCMLHYQMVPRVVMFNAIKHKSEVIRTQNIEILCRLDPWAHDLPVVSQWLNHPAGAVRSERMRKFRYLREQGINDGQFSMRQVKQCIGGFVHLMIEQTGHWFDLSTGRLRLQPPKVDRGVILNLFDAVERERTGNPLAEDEDLCGLQRASVYQQMRRASRDWRPLVVDDRRTKVA